MLKLSYSFMRADYLTSNFVVGDANSIWYLWFHLKNNKDICKLKVSNLDGIEIDVNLGLDFVCSNASY